MRRFVGKDQFVPGVPCRDLTEDEWREHVRAARIVEGDPAAKLWRKESDKKGGDD